MTDGTRRGFIFGAATVLSYGLIVGVQRVCLGALAYDDQPDGQPGTVTIIKFSGDGGRIGAGQLAKVIKSKAAWKKQLTPLQNDVTRRAATEWAFSGALNDQHAPGIYRCIDYHNVLFDSKTKFDSGTGWPSFWEPIAEENVFEKADTRYGVVRREVKCKLCDAHLGHVFPDGPEPTGLRHCMNSAALGFLPLTKA
jgi:peptide-methionine (R)-S-oxide reductase